MNSAQVENEKEEEFVPINDFFLVLLVTYYDSMILNESKKQKEKHRAELLEWQLVVINNSRLVTG